MLNLVHDSRFQIEDLRFVRSVWFFDGLVIIWIFDVFGLVARAATFGNSCNLHKSKMAAMDSG